MSNWISVKDRLPSQGDIVLVYRPNAHFNPANDPNIKICEYRGERMQGHQFTESIHQVTHWQPLPEPPKEK